MRKILFLERYLSLNFLVTASYLFAAISLGFYAKKDYNAFLEKKKFVVESLIYKVAFDFNKVFDDAESMLNQISAEIARSDGSKVEIGKILINREVAEENNLIQNLLSSGKLYWINNSNQLVATNEGAIESEIDLSDRDYLQKTSKNFNKIYSGDPIIGAASGQYVVPLGVGVLDKGNKYIGTLVISLKMSELLTRYEKIVDSESGVSLAILDLSNNIFLSPNNNFLNDHKLVDEISSSEIKNSNEFFQIDLFGRDNSYGVLRGFEKYPYKILVTYKNKIIKSELAIELLPWLIQFLFLTMFFILAKILLRR